MQFDTEKKFSPLAVTELDFAERAIIRAVQDASFSEELLSLKTSQKRVKKSSSIVKLDPVLVEGILCVGGRLHNSPIEQEAKHPALLPKDHHVSELIMGYYHLISGHSGVEHQTEVLDRSSKSSSSSHPEFVLQLQKKTSASRPTENGRSTRR